MARFLTLPTLLFVSHNEPQVASSSRVDLVAAFCDLSSKQLHRAARTRSSGAESHEAHQLSSSGDKKNMSGDHFWFQLGGEKFTR